jgi:predicted RNase H-like nuclease
VPVTIIGIDCATQPSKTCLSRAVFADGVLSITESRTAGRKATIAEYIYPWLRESRLSLIALDAPLGWPAALGRALSGHSAGGKISDAANKLFRRTTDEVVKEKLRKVPLDVGADRIARTAVAALVVLEELGKLVGNEISLAWSPGLETGVYAIEVYPAGTLRAYEMLGKVTHKGTTDLMKADLLERMEKDGEIECLGGLQAVIGNEHVLDSVICAIAARDFLNGKVVFPSEAQTALAEKEGWIWFTDTLL